MAKCKYCGKGNWFSSTDAMGLCRNCAPVIIPVIQSIASVVMNSLKLAQEGKTFTTRLSRCDLMIERAADLIEYEQKGITITQPPPSVIMREGQELRDRIIMDAAQMAAERARDKTKLAATARTKPSALGSGFLKAKEILRQSTSDDLGADLLEALKREAHEATLNGYLEAARKAEFKGNTKKSIDQYQEALFFFIKNDDIPDAQQLTEIHEIESALKSLEEKR